MIRSQLIGILSITLTSSAMAGLTPGNVLVIYNSQNSDSQAVKNYYQTARPGVLSFDLNDATLSPGNISYTDYESKIRDKVRNYLNTNNLQQQVSVLTLTKGLPHRITDVNAGAVGDNPFSSATQLFNANSTYSSVDSELVYLQQNLRTGESNAAMDSHADNFILNPYFGSSSSITSFNRSTINSSISYNANSIPQGGDPPLQYWDDNQPDAAGRIYLTARLDGNTVAQVTAMIDRAANINYNKLTDRLIIDENSGDEFDGTDYETTNTLVSSSWTNVSYDHTGAFYIGATGTVTDPNKQVLTGPIALLSTYGQNHTPGNTSDQTGYVGTFSGQFVDGAIFTSYESYNARDFAGLGTLFGQGQISEFLAAGGTLAEGNAWEPFTFGVPLNQPMLSNFYDNGLTWVEAAWSGQQTASWQAIVIGDPLAVVPEPGWMGILVISLPLFARRKSLSTHNSVT